MMTDYPLKFGFQRTQSDMEDTINVHNTYEAVDYIQNNGLKVCLRGLGRCCSGESAFSVCSRTAVRIFRTYIDAMRVQCPPVISASRRCRWGILGADWLARPPEWQALCSEVSASMRWNVVEDSIHINFGTIYVHVHLLRC